MQVLLVGDSNVGKSSLLLRFTADTFEDSVAPTIGGHLLRGANENGVHPNRSGDCQKS